MQSTTLLLLLAFVVQTCFASSSEEQSDDYCCPEGFEEVGGSCYLMDCPEMYWKDAFKFCDKHNAGLVVINSPEEGESLAEWLQEKGLKNTFWTGILGLGDYMHSLANRKKRSPAELLPYQCVLDSKKGYSCFNPGKSIAVCEAEKCEECQGKYYLIL